MGRQTGGTAAKINLIANTAEQFSDLPVLQLLSVAVAM